MAGVVQAIGKPRIAIVASRPRDHVRDATGALDAGAHVLVEKPLSDDVAAGRGLVQHARNQRRVLGIGTEFAYLPALHHLSQRLSADDASIGSIRMQWSDPAGEIRHGSQKREHTETGILEDLLPHMVSILRTLLPGAVLEVDAAQMNAGSGRMTLTDGTGRRCECFCSKQGNRRERLVQIDVGGTSVLLDFATAKPAITWGGQIIPVSQGFLALDSTLRLELGAFSLVTDDPRTASPLTDAVVPLLALQDQLASLCANVTP